MSSGVLSEARSDVYRAVTDKIVAAIEAGAGEFIMPWHRTGPAIGRPTNAETGNRYRGVNVVALWAEASLAGYGSGYWASYLQWQQRGAQVRKGERGSTILFYREIEPDEAARSSAGAGDDSSGRRFVAKASRVFNADQVDGWTPPGDAEVAPTVDHLAAAEEFVFATGATIRHGASIACYRRQEDRIDVPERRVFVGSPTSTPTESYYATLLHELVHWSGAAHRLDRTFGTGFGDAVYAAEELVAEIGAAFLCADFRVANEPRQDHAAYLSHWLKILTNDAKAIFSAARLATQASDYLWNLQSPEAEPAI